MLGKDIGSTNVIAWSKGAPPTITDVTVNAEPRQLEEEIARLLPGEPNVRVHMTAGSVVLSGSVEDAERYQGSMVKRNLVMRALQRCQSGTFIVWLDQVLPMYRKDRFDLEAVIGVVKSTNNRFRVLSVFKIERLEPIVVPRIDEESLYDHKPYDFVKVSFQLPEGMEVEKAKEDERRDQSEGVERHEGDGHEHPDHFVDDDRARVEAELPFGDPGAPDPDSEQERNRHQLRRGRRTERLQPEPEHQAGRRSKGPGRHRDLVGDPTELGHGRGEARRHRRREDHLVSRGRRHRERQIGQRRIGQGQYAGIGLLNVGPGTGVEMNAEHGLDDAELNRLACSSLTQLDRTALTTVAAPREHQQQGEPQHRRAHAASPDALKSEPA